MNELIKITEQNGQQVVSARELHAFLEVETRFNDWIIRMFEYGFIENVDYQVLLKNEYNPNGGRPQTDYALSLDCAKEISMLQRSEKGKQARQYFIEMEKIAKQQKKYIPSDFEIETIKIKKIEILNNVMNTVSNPLYKDTLSSIITKEITGKEYLPLPKVEKSTYNATEICNLIAEKYNIKVSTNKIGKIANRHNLKNQDNGMFVWDKSKYSHKQVEAFRYYEHMVDVFYRELLKVA